MTNHHVRTLLASSLIFAIPVIQAFAQDQTVQTPENSGAFQGGALGSSDRVARTVPDIRNWHPNVTRDNAQSVRRIIGADVYGVGGQDIGDVVNLLIGRDGRVLSLVAEVSGTWSIGDTHVNIPWSKVTFDRTSGHIVIPVTEDSVDDFPLFSNNSPGNQVTAQEAQNRVMEVSGDGWGTVDTGPRTWRATELLDDYVRLRGDDAAANMAANTAPPSSQDVTGSVDDRTAGNTNEGGMGANATGNGYRNYGYVADLILQNGAVTAVVTRPDVGYAGRRGAYAYPFFGYGYGWEPGRPYYDLPYSRQDISDLQPMNEGMWGDAG